MVDEKTTRVATCPCSILLLLSGGTARAEDADEANPYLVKSLPRATVTLAQALSMVKPPAATLSAKYEVGDRGRLSLSMYVAAHGVRDANRASLEEVSGDPLAAWICWDEPKPWHRAP